MNNAELPQSGEPEKKIELCVVCGHLAFARYPVMVGHYNGDTFAGTEARLDQVLDGRLSERRRMGLYPGPIGSSVVVLDSNAKPPGAVVIGLGESAGLSIGTLRRALRHGILAFAAARADQCRSSGAAGGSAAPLQLSPLLIGAGEGGLDQVSCVQALLSATKEAQAILSKMKLPARLAAIEIFELYADRANATLRAVKRTLGSDPALKVCFDLTPEVKAASYGRKSAPVEADPSWWQPIQITMSGERRREHSLSFTIGGGFARAEARTIAANLDLVMPLVRRVSRSKKNDATPSSPGRTLFELLWPASLKDQSADERNRRLILDERSASFPWEMLDDQRPWMQDEESIEPPEAPVGASATKGEAAAVRIKPPAVRAGMIRQLLQTRFREEIVAPHGKRKALIIGNPGGGTIDGMADLSGAEREAETIAGLLEKTHEVTLFGKDAVPEEICRKLFTDAWEIFHISAHGVLKQPFARPDGVKRPMTGIVLGRGMVLSPSALANLPVSPGIVFVNCCYLGNIGFDLGKEEEEDDEAREARLSGRPEFAASVAVELIKLGARCVIAAGWAVDDKAAARFGETFYEKMLELETFGNATLLARQKAYEEFPDSNTWGAFQCYGDPDYRLRPAPSVPRDQIKPSSFVAISEAIDAAQRIRDEVNIGLERSGGSQSADRLRSRLAEIDDDVRNNRGPKWLAAAELRVALAEAWGELGDLGKAIEHYKAAVSSPDTSFKVRAIEQLANLSARNAVVAIRALVPEKRDPAKIAEEIRTCLRKIEGLTALLGETRERLSLQGGCWKRLAQVQPAGSDADFALERMADCYGRAAAIEEPGDKSYPLLMACSARLCAAVRAGRDCDAAVIKPLQGLIDAMPPEDADFWQLIQWADARTAEVILRSPDPSEEQQSLVKAYARAWHHLGSPVKLSSVLEQLDFYEDIFSFGAPDTKTKRTSIQALANNLRNTLEANFLIAREIDRDFKSPDSCGRQLGVGLPLVPQKPKQR